MRIDAVRRVLETELAAARRRHPDTPPRLVDVGGGSGGWAVPFAVAGCQVTVVDPSPNALAALTRRAAEAGVVDRIVGTQGDADALDQLVAAESADLVLAHGLLEVVDDVDGALKALIAATTPGGAVSLLVANRYGAVLNRALAGRLTDARRLLTDGRLTDTHDPLRRRFDQEGLCALVNDAGLTVELCQGQGVLSDLIPGSVLKASPTAAEELAELETAAASVPPLRAIAARLHVLARRQR